MDEDEKKEKEIEQKIIREMKIRGIIPEEGVSAFHMIEEDEDEFHFGFDADLTIKKGGPPFGFKVAIKFTMDSPYKLKGSGNVILRNVTEIHYRYDKVVLNERIAFESTIHHTGVTYALIDIAEFEAVLETEKAEES